MANDYLKKQPTKTEKLVYELFMRQDDLAKSVWSTSSLATALGYLLKVDPEKLAKMLTEEHEKIKEYSEKINKAIAEIEAKKKGSEPGDQDDKHDHSEETGPAGV